MSLIEYTRRRTDVEDAVRSDDSALNIDEDNGSLQV